MAMPFGTTPIRLPRPRRLVEFEKTLLVKFEFQESEDGLTAWGEVIPMLTLPLVCIPIVIFPPIDEPLMIFFGADAFRLYKDNNTQPVLCVVKAMIERKDLEGDRLQGWVINSAMSCIKATIYEGGDSYVGMSTNGSMIQKQLDKLQPEGLTTYKLRDTDHHREVRLGIFGDMAFINSTLGSGGCSTRNCFPKCDCEKR
jgi:hypothetical protein